MKQWIKKLGIGIMIIFLLMLMVSAGERQEYQYQGNVSLYPDSIPIIQEWCDTKGFNTLPECADFLVERQVDQLYFNNINGDAQAELSRILNSRNATAILLANQTLSEITT